MSQRRHHAPPSLDEYTDSELLRLHRSDGNRQALGTLFKRYAHKVFGLSLSYLKNHQDAEDAVMEIFELVMQQIDGHAVQQFDAWLYTVARNHCLRLLRRKLHLHHDDIAEISPDLFVEKEAEETLYKEDEQLEQLSNAIDRLKEEQRDCVVMFYLEQRSYREIAARTRFSLNQVKSYIQNGKRNLQNALIATR